MVCVIVGGEGEVERGGVVVQEGLKGFQTNVANCTLSVGNSNFRLTFLHSSYASCCGCWLLYVRQLYDQSDIKCKSW